MHLRGVILGPRIEPQCLLLSSNGDFWFDLGQTEVIPIAQVASVDVKMAEWAAQGGAGSVRGGEFCSMVKSDHLRKPRSWYPGASPVTPTSFSGG